jgi:hypothetical protein
MIEHKLCVTERLELLLVHLVREKREMNNMRVQIGGLPHTHITLHLHV